MYKRQGFLQLSFLTFLSPIVWFYSFFHTNNLNSLSDEEFYSLEDDYLIHFSDISSNQDTVKKHYKLIAGCLIFFGISVLWKLFSRMLFWYIIPALYLTDEAAELILSLIHISPDKARKSDCRTPAGSLPMLPIPKLLKIMFYAS